MKVSRVPGYTRVELGGQPGLGQLLSLLQVLEVDSQAWPRDGALLDVRGVETRFGPEDQQRIAHEAAHQLRRLKRVAVLCAPGRLREGAGLRVFETELAAVTWLRG